MGEWQRRGREKENLLFITWYRMHAGNPIMCFHYNEKKQDVINLYFLSDQVLLCSIVCCHLVEQATLRNVEHQWACAAVYISKSISFLFCTVLPGIKAELRYARPSPMLKVNDTCIVCLLFYTVLNSQEFEKLSCATTIIFKYVKVRAMLHHITLTFP